MKGRTLEHLVRPRTAGVGLDVFAVEPDAAQLTWSHLPAGTHTCSVDGREQKIDQDRPGPGVLDLDRLTPGRHRVTVSTGGQTLARRSFSTIAPPPGPELFRFATISDLHLGRGDTKYRGPLARREAPAAPGSVDLESDRQFRCARAAIDEALAWGAQLLVVKGDLCDETVDWIWDQAAALLGDLPVPVAILPGNHDTGALRHFEPEAAATARGLHVSRGVEHLDVPGGRIVLAESTNPGNGWGSIARHAEQVATLAGEADGAVFVATHHHPQRTRVPLFWPHGIPGVDADEFARAVVAANPKALASSGHTHRCRRRVIEGLTWTEVAATNHFPGVWAGYALHEGGVRQVVRRIAEPQPLAWIEGTRHMLRGTWALWSTGTMSDRSFSLSW